MKENIFTIDQLLHGADYNPEQWLDHPEILEEDIKMMKAAKCNVMSVGIFSWAVLEPEEGVYRFEWLQQVIDNLYENGIYTILATPSGARPNWLAEKYPEVLRVESNRVRNLFGGRHNHCYTSPIYREKIANINKLLVERFVDHPGVILWHISNEYGGECHCELCQDAFREWLKDRYKDLQALNDAWCTTFWSHTYTSWDQINSPAPHGENALHALTLDWKRFVSYQTIEFIKHEKAVVHSVEEKLPTTINMMYYFKGINYFDLKDVIDIASWDSYPTWHKQGEKDSDIAASVAMYHDLMRSIKNKPFLLMESTPSMTNWQQVSKLKKPNMHKLSSIQAVAHGSDSVQYFQWRKSRGASEKFHGAVVDHYGKMDTRVFKDVTDVGECLEEWQQVKGSTTKAEVAILYDWENMWAIEGSQGPRNIGMEYKETIIQHYRTFWEKGVAVDIVDMTADLSKYKVFIAPLMYMLRADIAQKIEQFVAKGGHFVTTYCSGVVDENDKCYLGGVPYGLMDILGIRSEEIDALYDDETNSASPQGDIPWAKNASYTCHYLCERIQVNTAQVLLKYNEDFYKEEPVVTCNQYNNGKAYYIASRFKAPFFYDFYDYIIDEASIACEKDTQLVEGVIVTTREDDNNYYKFIQNYNNKKEKIVFRQEVIELEKYDVQLRIIAKK